MTKSVIKIDQSMVMILLGIFIAYLLLKNRSQSAIGFKNAETWEWVDWKGRQRGITVHRDVKAIQ